MKKDAKSEAIRYWWEKAFESMEAARRDLAAEAFSFAINRAYYALFIVRNNKAKSKPPESS